jgi:hypothetical protein
MWVDPDDDPRNSSGVRPDGELATLQDYLTNNLTPVGSCIGISILSWTTEQVIYQFGDAYASTAPWQNSYPGRSWQLRPSTGTGRPALSLPVARWHLLTPSHGARLWSQPG